jgi:hypothetical protein
MGGDQEVRVMLQSCLKSLSIVALAGAVACSSGKTGNATPAAGQPPAAAPAGQTGSGAPAATPANAPAGGRGLPAVPEIPQPAFRDVTIPAGSTIEVSLETPLASNRSNVEDAVRARVTKAVVVDGTTAIPAGAEVTGSVLEANPSGKVKGRASIALRFLQLHAGDTTVPISTPRISRQAKSTTGEDAKKVGIGAAAGAVIGAIAGGGKGAAIGTAVGAGAGAGAVVATAGDEVELPEGTAFSLKLDDAIRVQVPNK